MMQETNNDIQVKSKKRVADHGEVFTSEREVNAMLDLVKQETERIESRFLEPACGTGNFLVEILRRKLAVVDNRYKAGQSDWELYAVIAVSSIYGVDILMDNVQECRARLFLIFEKHYAQLFKKNCKSDVLKSVQFILSRNILWGDALNLKTPNAQAEPIIFSEWSAVGNGLFKRRDFTLAKLLEGDLKQFNAKKYKAHEIPLFSDEGDPAFIPQPVKEFPVTHFLKLTPYDNDSG